MFTFTESCSIHFVLWCFVPEEGWNSGYYHGSLFVPEKRAIFMALCLCQRRGLYSWLCVCAREGVEIWLYSWFCVCAREGVEIWLYSWLCACVCQRRGRNLAIFMALCLCQRRGRNLAHLCSFGCTVELNFGQCSYSQLESIHALLEPWADKGYNPKPGPGSGQTEMTSHGLNNSICDFLSGLGRVCKHGRKICKCMYKWTKLEVVRKCYHSWTLHGFTWVQVVAHLLLPWFRVTSPFQSSFLAKHAFIL